MSYFIVFLPSFFSDKLWLLHTELHLNNSLHKNEQNKYLSSTILHMKININIKKILVG